MGSSGSGSKGRGEARGLAAWAARGPAEGEKWRAGPVVWSRGLGRLAREAGL